MKGAMAQGIVTKCSPTCHRLAVEKPYFPAYIAGVDALYHEVHKRRATVPAVCRAYRENEQQDGGHE
jgi:hypothetical protein